MSGKTKIYIAVLYSLIFIVNSVDVASASIAKPSNVWNWSNGIYYFSGTADNQDLYTNYKFTNMTSAKITVNNTSGTYALVVDVKSVEPWYRADAVVSTRTISANGTSTWTISGLDSSKNYYIVFYAPCKFNGSIEKK